MCRRRLRCTHRVRYEYSVIRFFFVRLSGDWYKATSKYWIIWVSPRFHTFVSLVQLRLFSTSQYWAVRCKAGAQSAVRSSSSSAGLFRSLLVSHRGRYLPWYIYFSGSHANSRGHTSRLRVARGHTFCLACHPRNLRSTSAYEAAFCLL